MSEFSETMFFIHALQNVQVQHTKKYTKNERNIKKSSI